MTALPRPCLGWRDEKCGEPAVGGRCPRHQAMLVAARPSPSKRFYDRQYQKDRAKLLAPSPDGERVRCQLRLKGCTTWADTADHVIAGDSGRNPLARRGPLRPACGHCNSSRGKRDVAADPVETSPEPTWHPDP